MAGGLPLRIAAARSTTPLEPAPQRAASRLLSAGHTSLLECGPAGGPAVAMGDVQALLSALSVVRPLDPDPPSAPA